MSDELNSNLPNFRDSTKFFSFQNLHTSNPPFQFLPAAKILTTNGQNLVRDFNESAGEFLGGGVMKSKQLEAYAEKDERCRQIKERILSQSRFLSTKENLRLSTQITSEWIAFEYALLLSVTLYGLIKPMKWDQFQSIKVKKKGLMGIESIATLTYVDSLGEKQVVDIQSGKPNIDSLVKIARAVGV